jgi:periplasmic protein TonB
MSNLLEAGEEIRRTFGREPMAGPAAGSLALHGALACTIVFYALVNGFFHHNTWGGTPGGGAIQVQITSSLPLPSVPVNNNVLSTESPTETPALPETKPQQEQLDLKAIPIPGKQTKAKPQPLPKTPQRKVEPREQQNPVYGEQAGSVIPRAVAPSASNGPTAVNDSDFGSRFPWYVDGINRKMAQTWNKREVDPSTPRGARVYVIFSIHRNGDPADVQLDRSSGSGSLDSSCIRAVQRVDTFGMLPSGYNQGTLKVSFYCEY